MQDNSVERADGGGYFASRLLLRECVVAGKLGLRSLQNPVLVQPMSGESPEQFAQRIGIEPILTRYAETGYHGTSAESASKIVSNGFDPALRKAGLFGRGFYFYEDAAPHGGIVAALHFLRTWKGFAEVAVLKMDVSVTGESLFDLLVETNWELFETVQRELIKMASERGVVARLDVRTIGTATAEFIMRHFPAARTVEAVRALFRMPNMHPPHQRGGCARHKNCIVNIEKITLP